MSVEIVAMKMGASPEVAKALEDTCLRFNIVTQNQKSHFLGQIFVESAGFKVFRENLNYSVDGLLRMFGRHRITASDAMKYGRAAGKHPANQEALANILYGGAFGAKNLGNVKPTDGWAFIGRGLKQLTGRANYTAYSMAMYGDDRIVQNSILLERLPDAALSAGWFWTARNLNPLADANAFEQVTKKINGGLNGYKERVAATQRAWTLFESLKG